MSLMRGGPGANALVLALLVGLATLAQAQAPATWDELAGGAARTGAAFLPATTLDVLEARDLFGNDTEIDLRYSKGLVSTPHGLLALAQRGEECLLLTIGEEVEETVLDACTLGTLTAYDRANDQLLICVRGAAQSPIFQARDARTGELKWGVRPVDLGSAGAPIPWDCRGTALAPQGTALVALYSVQAGPELAGGVPTNAIVARVNTTSGIPEWDVAITAGSFYSGPLPTSPEVGTGGFVPFGISITESGVVVSGRATCACGKGDPIASAATATVQGAVAWMRMEDGALVGGALAEDDPDALLAGEGVPERKYGQWWATTQGPLAGFALGERVMLVNPAETKPVRATAFEGLETGQGFIGTAPSVWWGSTLIVPIVKSVTAVDAGSLDLATMWSRTLGDQWIVSGTMVAPPSDLLVAVSDYGTDTPDEDVASVIHRLDLATGNELQRIPLPGTIRSTSNTGRMAFQPLENGELVVFTLDGRLFRLGNADPQIVPRVDVSHAYPDPRDAVDVDIADPVAGATYIVAWGDDTIEEGGTSWSHRYGSPGTRTLRVTALYADGRTATTERAIHVGATPPPDTFLARQFSSENQERTFFVLGIVVTLLGALIAFLVRRRRRGRLGDELRRLEEIRERGRRDPATAIRDLGLYRERLLGEVRAHKLDDAQFNTLEARANVVFSALRTRLLGPLAGRISADFRHALDVVLHDGRVDAEELSALRGALDAERDLASDERARLAAMLERMARG